MGSSHIKSVAVIGAGASGAAAAAALQAEQYFERIRVYERRETPGGTWIFDPDAGAPLTPPPGRIPPDIDPPLKLPNTFPTLTKPSAQDRFIKTPVYAELTTNVPAIAMSFSDGHFPYGPFVPHWVPKECIQNYFSHQRTDSLLSLNTTVEDLARLPRDRWSLTLRRYDPSRNLDEWWQEEFDSVILCNGHYTVPYIPPVPGLEAYIERYPGRVFHSKSYRTANSFVGKKVMIIGNSASGHDVTMGLISKAQHPVYQSRRSRSHWDGDGPPEGIVWKPVITNYDADSGNITFSDGTTLGYRDVDFVIYCTGYKPSFPFWNPKTNGGPIWDYKKGRLAGTYLHTFFRNYPTLGLVGMPRTLTFRSFEYQAIALARLFAGRNKRPLPERAGMKRWEEERDALVARERRKFHDIPWDDGETLDYFRTLYDLAGLPELEGQGKYPPVLDSSTRWAVEHIKKYPETGKREVTMIEGLVDSDAEWVIVQSTSQRDSLHFI